MTHSHEWTCFWRYMLLILYGRRLKDAAAAVALGAVAYGVIYVLFSIPD